MTELACIAVLSAALMFMGRGKRDMSPIAYEMDWTWDERGTVTLHYHTSETFRFVVEPGRSNRLALNAALRRIVADEDLPFEQDDAKRVMRIVMQAQGANT